MQITEIKTKKQHKAALAFIEPFLKKGISVCSKKETTEMHRVAMLIHEYEKVHYPIPIPPKSETPRAHAARLYKGFKAYSLKAATERQKDWFVNNVTAAMIDAYNAGLAAQPQPQPEPENETS